MKVSLAELIKAIASLETSMRLYQETSGKDIEVKRAFRDACIQRFEYSIELAWKTSMKVLGSGTVAAKPAIREMARSNLISNSEMWLSFIDSRNETSHSYDEEVAIKVYQAIEKFLPEVTNLLANLKKSV